MQASSRGSTTPAIRWVQRQRGVIASSSQPGRTSRLQMEKRLSGDICRLYRRQAAHQVQFGFMAEYSIGVDLGGTNLRAAAIGRDGEVLGKIAGRAQLSQGRDTVIHDMVSSITKLRGECGANQLAGVGIGVPGFILMEKGIILGSNNLPEFEGFEVRDHIEQKLGARVVLENDANAAALGEKWMGAGRDVDDLVLLTLGTGIGGGIICGGRVLRGHIGMAGELGHITVVPNGNPCGCGNQGCLEKHASATAITAMARLMQLGEELSAKDVYNLARHGGKEGDKARTIWRVAGES